MMWSMAPCGIPIKNTEAITKYGAIISWISGVKMAGIIKIREIMPAKIKKEKEDLNTLGPRKNAVFHFIDRPEKWHVR
jgi:hypothetical protein